MITQLNFDHVTMNRTALAIYTEFSCLVASDPCQRSGRCHKEAYVYGDRIRRSRWPLAPACMYVVQSQLLLGARAEALCA